MNVMIEIIKEIIPLLNFDYLLFIFHKLKSVPLEKIRLFLDLLRLLNVSIIDHQKATVFNFSFFLFYFSNIWAIF